MIGGGEAWRRGAALIDLGRPQEAIEHLHHALAADPQDATTHCLIALAELRLSRYQEAAEASAAAVAIAPAEERPHRMRALALLGLGRKREAREAALESCRLQPGEAMAHVVLASVLQMNGDEPGAEAAARHAVALAPESPEARSQLGTILLAQDRPAEAAEALEGALALDPTDSDAINDHAVARLRARRRSGVTRQFEAAMAMDPRSDVARHNILAVGGPARSRVWRRFSVVMVALAVFTLPAAIWAAVAFYLGAAAVFEAIRWAEVRRLSPATRALLRDDNRARRFKPLRWDWRWPTRLRPWWWVALTSLPPPFLLAVNLALLILGIADHIVFWIVAMGIALPFSGLRTRRWWRRRRPGRGSWRPPA